MLKEFLKEAVVTIVESGPDSGTNFSKGLREYNMNPIQVRYLAALHPEVVAKSSLCLPSSYTCYM